MQLKLSNLLKPVIEVIEKLLSKVSGGFQKISGGGAKALNMPSILEETRVYDYYLGMFVDYMCFS